MERVIYGLNYERACHKFLSKDRWKNIGKYAGLDQSLYRTGKKFHYKNI